MTSSKSLSSLDNLHMLNCILPTYVSPHLGYYSVVPRPRPVKECNLQKNMYMRFSGRVERRGELPGGSARLMPVEENMDIREPPHLRRSIRNEQRFAEFFELFSGSSGRFFNLRALNCPIPPSAKAASIYPCRNQRIIPFSIITCSFMMQQTTAFLSSKNMVPTQGSLNYRDSLATTND